MDRNPSIIRDKSFLGSDLTRERIILRYLDETLVIESALISVNRSKSITFTDLKGSNSTVKEIYSISDYSIGINGLLFNETSGVVPEKAIIALENMFEYNGEIDVENDFLNTKGIYSIVISDYNMEQSRVENVQSFSLSATSEKVKK